MKLNRAAIEAALKDTGGNIGEAARKLGVARRTVQNRLREYVARADRSKGGRPRKTLKYGRRTALYAVGGAAAAVVGYLALSRRGSSA